MLPEQENRIREIIREESASLFSPTRYIFSKLVQFLDGRNIQVGKSTGTKIGTETTQKIGFYGKAPIAQNATITAPAGGGSGSTDAVDISARAAISEIKAFLTLIGLTG